MGGRFLAKLAEAALEIGVKTATRQICGDCGLQYRHDSDFQEHKRVGCRMQTSEGPTWSAKEVESESELISKDIAEAIAGLAPSDAMRLPEDEEAPKVSRFDRNPE